MPEPCDCIDKINEQLADQNAALDIPYIINIKTGKQILPHVTKVVCYKFDSKKRSKIPHVLARFCPFCGQEYFPEVRDEVRDEGREDETGRSTPRRTSG